MVVHIGGSADTSAEKVPLMSKGVPVCADLERGLPSVRAKMYSSKPPRREGGGEIGLNTMDADYEH